MQDTLFKGRSPGEWLKPQVLVTIILIIAIIGATAVFLITRRGDTVAVVNGEKISKEDLYQAMLAGGGQEALDQVITRKLIEQEGRKHGIKVSSEEVDAEIDKLIQESFYGDPNYFNMVLEQYGVSLENVKKDVKLELTARKIASAGLEFTEKELEEFFDKNRTRYDIPEEIEARHILVETAEEAAEILALLQGGSDFAALAKERSEDPGSAANGGNLGFFPRGKMMPEFEDAAFALEKGKYSEPVETYYGFHIIELLDRKPGRGVSFAEVKEKVLKDKTEAELPALIQELVKSLRDSASITTRL